MYSIMERFEQCRYAVYFDVPNPHVIIHKIGPHTLEIHGGNHIVENKSGWGYFVEEHEANSFAKGVSESKNIPKPSYCKKCYKS